MDVLSSELDVPAKYMELTDGKICATVHRNWLANLWNVGPIHFFTHNRLSMDEIAARPSLEDLGPSWTRIYVRVYEKQNRNAIPLPRDRHSTSAKVQPELTFAQLLRYVAETNYRNLWKESYKKYYSLWNTSEQKEQSYAIPSSSDVAVMREVLARMYGCPLIKIRNGQVTSVNPRTSSHSHCNLLPTLLAIETPVAFMTFHEQTARYSLQECVMYSPAALSTSYSKPLFLVYQLLRLSRDLYDQGLALGEITLGDILIMDNFTIQVMPKLSDNIYLKSDSDDDSAGAQESKLSPALQDHTRKFAACQKLGVTPGSPDFGRNENIEKLCELWLHGQISNFDYLTALNNLAGRRYGDPSCHHVMPWVTDFSSRCGRNWRDLTKSKFRLNKGDRQLDLTFDSEAIDVGHHVSDVLSEITYYVYLSRRYTKSVLCKHVRSHWVPWEYPVSIQRLHEWSPDECIPQFFTDPSVFKSIHEDLPDLELPGWARSPEDFIEKHREALESLYVSERLHQWIDLTFGYKLSGVAAIKSKNVCLQLVDNHTSLTNSGVVQLFVQPHPQKIVPSPYWSKMPPRLRNSASNPKLTKNERSSDRISEDEGQSSGIEEEESPVTTLNVARSSPLALSRLLSRSRGSLLAVDDNSNKPEKPTAQTIILPKDYNPIAALLQVETTHAFMNKISHRTYKPEISHHAGTASYKQIVASGRMREQQILGCLMVEIFLAGKFRATWNTGRVSFSSRLETCLNILRVSPESLPRCVRNAVALLLQIDVIPKTYAINTEPNDCSRSGVATSSPFRYHMVTCMGLPPPSAHQFLQPVLSGSLFPSSRYFQCLFSLVEMLQEYGELVRELNAALQDDEESEAAAKTKIRFLCKISECKVKAVARELERLLPQAGAAMETSLQLIVPHVRQIMDEPYSAVLAAWHLFDPIAKALGPRETSEIFLASILRLYENGSIMDSLHHVDVLPAGLLAKFRTMRLYHRSFLLKLMVRLGLRRFLDNFATPLVEAVGGYRDYLQGAAATNVHRSGNLKTCDLSGSCGDGEAILSPLDEDSSMDSENNASPPGETAVEDCGKNVATAAALDNEVEEVFTMETEESPSPSDTARIPIIDIQAELSLNLNLMEDLAEDARNSPPGSVKSPTIPIPRRSDGATKSVIDFNSIGCHVGSKTSSEDMPIVGSYAGRIQTAGSAEAPRRLVIRSDQDDKSEDEETQEDQRRFAPSECKVSEMSAESVIWLSHRLGPVLTARHLSRNLLRMLTLCYAGRSNLAPSLEADDSGKTTLAGDRNAVKVLECLTAIASLYGEQIILLQYLAHMTELLTLCKRKLTPNLEGGLVSCLALLVHIAPCLSDAFLMDALQETIIKSILHPTVRVLSTTRYNFPNGAMARSALADKYLEAIFTISVRLGSAMTKSHLAVPIQRFFLAFDKAFGPNKSQTREEDAPRGRNDRPSPKSGNSQENKLNDSQDWTLVNNSGCESQLLSGVNSDVAISYSPPVVESDDVANTQRNKAFEELREVFTSRFAHRAYLLFYRHVDEGVMEEILKNHRLVRELCHEYEQDMQAGDAEGSCPANAAQTKEDDSSAEVEAINKGIGSFGNISVIGNRIEVQTEPPPSRPSGPPDSDQPASRESSSASSAPSAGRQLRGNWLAYWEHEIGRPDKDSTFNMKQIKLQSFGGHTNSIRCIFALDNENSFMSGARDKSVKLWSLRSQGDGSTVSTCQYTYTGHKKSILALTFLESLRYAVTCDSAVHCWDPFMGSLLGCPESSKPAPVNTLAASPAPSTSLLAATTDITLRVIDCRTFQYVNEMKVSMNPTGLIRCIAVAPSGYWVALGQASGFLTILDIRTGLIIASWKGHECEILQLEAVNETTIVSSSLDQTIAVWSAVDGKLKFHLKGATEPVHCLAVYEQQLISGTTANRIGVHTAVDASATFSSSKLRTDAFKGVITAMAVLPLNRLLLLGADNGGISLLC